jgi:two-component system, NarL family, nitrate/nitrite response regulator NarL
VIAESARVRRELSDIVRAASALELVATTASIDELDVARSPAATVGTAALASVARFDGDRDADVLLIELAPHAVRGATASAAEGELRPLPFNIDELGSAVVLLSDDPELHPGPRFQRAGLALLPTRATPEQIVAAIGAVAQGLFVLHADVAAPLTARADHSLTPREREVLQMLAAGLGNKAIGLRLGISEHTAKFHVAQILAKLDAASRAEAVSIAMRRGLVPL